MNTGLLKGLVTVKQHRTQKRTARTLFNSCLLIRVPKDDLTGAGKILDPVTHLFTLSDTGQGTHGYSFNLRITHHHPAELFPQRRNDCRSRCTGHHGPPDRGAFLPALYRHFAHHLFDVEIELGGSFHRIRTQYRGVE